MLKKTQIDCGQCNISLFDNKLNEIVSQTMTGKNGDAIVAEISLPNKLIIRIKSCTDKCAPELDCLRLAGIEVRSDVLLNLSEYKYASNHDMIAAIEQLDELESLKTLCWDRDGYAVFNLFHPNPFAWHMYVGNKIKI